MGHPLSSILPVPKTEGQMDRMCTQKNGVKAVCSSLFVKKNRANENVFKIKVFFLFVL